MNTTSTDLLEQIGKAEEAFTVRRVFGEPFEKDGVVVIPGRPRPRRGRRWRRGSSRWERAARAPGSR